MLIDRLQAADVAELVRAVSQSAAVPEAVAGPLYAETQGLPFFIVEYLREMLSQRTDELPHSLPGGVRALLRSRVAAVSETGAQVLPLRPRSGALSTSTRCATRAVAPRTKRLRRSKSCSPTGCSVRCPAAILGKAQPA